MWLLFLVTGWVTMNAQQYQLKGEVLDAAGEAIIGATVMVEGTSTGTATDIDGSFTINVADGDVLAVSYVGYLSQKIKITGQRNLKITLLVDDQLLDEVVVVGYGSIQRKNFTGSVSTVKVADSPLSIIPTSNAMDALRGTVTGITVSQQQGAGQVPSMVVRGQKSINGGSDPLLVVDGVIFQGALRDIDPSIIESMSVLKDATSLAAYGSQAANGVIMITTKKGSEGKPLISLSPYLLHGHGRMQPRSLISSAPQTTYVRTISLPVLLRMPILHG